MSQDHEHAVVVPADKDIYCLDCGYNLRGLSGMERTCPECGRCNPLDQRLVDPAIIAKMRTKLTRRDRRASVIAACCVLLFALATQEAAPCVIAALLALFTWACLYLSVVGDDPTNETGAGSIVMVSHLLVTLAAAGALLLPWLCVALNRKHHWWNAFDDTVVATVVPWLVTLVAIGAFAAWPYRAVRRRVNVFLDARAVQLARRWHRDRLRTPPQRRSRWFGVRP
jgi:hypothetical protein